MIQTDTELKVTQDAARAFRAALQMLAGEAPRYEQLAMWRAKRDAMAAQLADLEGEIAEYLARRARLP